MTIDQELRLSYYQDVADINAAHGISLVKNVRTGKFYVKKRLTVYNAGIYRYLLGHPIANTPELYLAEEDETGLTVIEEFIPGDTLEELLEQKGTLPEEQVIAITSQLCSILAAFHSCTPPIVNRDIKPSNIKLTPDGVVKLLDLNAAKWSSGQSARDTVLLGTQGYAAPEQYGFGPSSILTDIYSVGVLMNVMLTGQFPNQGIAGGPLGRVIRKCVELSPAGRYQSMAELQAALPSPSGGPRTSNPVSSWRRFLPPGYRGKNVLTWLLATLGYFLLFSVCASLQVENAGPAETVLNRIACTIAAVGIVLFTGNYMGVQERLGLTRCRRWVRRLGVALIDFAILFLAVILLDIVVAVFIR